MMEAKQLSCLELVREKFNQTEQDYKNAQDYFNQPEPEENDEYECYEDFIDYVHQTALCWDYVEKGTFDGQERGYFRLQLSWGGPGDEFRIYVDYDKSIDYIEYWYLDWYDGASVLVGADTASHYVCSGFLEVE